MRLAFPYINGEMKYSTVVPNDPYSGQVHCECELFSSIEFTIFLL